MTDTKTKCKRTEIPSDWRHSNYGRLILNSLRLFEDYLLAKLRSEGHEDIRIAHLTLMRHVDQDGSRISDIASEAGYTKQAASQFVSECEKMGLLTCVQSDDDKRAKRVLFTKYGRDILDISHKIISDLEAEMSARIGVRRFADVKRGIVSISEYMSEELGD